MYTEEELMVAIFVDLPQIEGGECLGLKILRT